MDAEFGLRQDWLDEPEPGAVAVELWQSAGREGTAYGYTLLPLLGDWVALLTEPGRLETWRENLERGAHLHFEAMRVNVYGESGWDTWALWAPGSEVQWTSSPWFYPFRWSVWFRSTSGDRGLQVYVEAEDALSALRLAKAKAGPGWYARPRSGWLDRAERGKAVRREYYPSFIPE